MGWAIESHGLSYWESWAVLLRSRAGLLRVMGCPIESHGLSYWESWAVLLRVMGCPIESHGLSYWESWAGLLRVMGCPVEITGCPIESHGLSYWESWADIYIDLGCPNGNHGEAIKQLIRLHMQPTRSWYTFVWTMLPAINVTTMFNLYRIRKNVWTQSFLFFGYNVNPWQHWYSNPWLFCLLLLLKARFTFVPLNSLYRLLQSMFYCIFKPLIHTYLLLILSCQISLDYSICWITAQCFGWRVEKLQLCVPSSYVRSLQLQ